MPHSTFFRTVSNPVFACKGLVYACAAALLATAVQAAEPVNAPQWKGEGELGYVAARGNTETSTISGKLKVSYASGPWLSEVALNTLQATATDQDTGEEEETADRFQISGQSNYAFSAEHYTFASLRYEEDEYSGYASQTTAAVGYGYHFLTDDAHKLSAEIGAGARESEFDDSGETENEFIVRARVTHGLQINATSRWTNELLVESGEDNRFTEFLTGFKFDLNSRLAMKLAWAYRHNSEVPADRKNKDTLTTINLVYGF